MPGPSRRAASTKIAQVPRALARRAEHAAHIEVIVRVGDDVAEAGRPSQPLREGLVDDAGPGQAAEGIGIAGRCSEVPPDTGCHGDVDDDLDRLPQVKDDGIRGIRCRPELALLGGQAFGHARQMAANHHDALGQDVAVETAHGRKRAST